MGFEDGEECSEVGLDLLVKVGELWGFKDDLEWAWGLCGWCGEDAEKSVLNDSTFGRPAINPSGVVPRQEGLCGGEGRFEQVAREDIPGHISVEALAGVIRMERNQTIKAKLFQLVFEKEDFRLGGVPSEGAVQVLVFMWLVGIIFVAGGITNRIDEQFIAGGRTRIFDEPAQQLDERHGACRLVSMNPAKQPKPLVCPPARRTDKHIFRDLEGTTTTLELGQRRKKQVPCGQICGCQWLEELPETAALTHPGGRMRHMKTRRLSTHQRCGW